jgi:hypothetical protein
MLRASIGSTPALAFAFEDPNSAEVLVGEVEPGAHDLVLYDGRQEVLRQPKAIVIESSSPSRAVGVGALIHLDKSIADSLTSGALAADGPHDTIIELGPPREGPGGLWLRPAEIMLQCDTDPNAEGCTVGGAPLSSHPLPSVTLVDAAGRVLTFALTDLFPDAKPSIVTATTRFAGPAEVLNQILLGDRDILLDDRAAVVIAVGSIHQAGGTAEVDVRLRLGADEEPDGLRYRGRTLRAGAALPLLTERYVLEGTLLHVMRDARGSK